MKSHAVFSFGSPTLVEVLTLKESGHPFRSGRSQYLSVQYKDGDDGNKIKGKKFYHLPFVLPLVFLLSSSSFSVLIYTVIYTAVSQGLKGLKQELPVKY